MRMIAPLRETLGGGYYVWRSGCARATQLDINPDWMSFMYYRPKRHPADLTPVNLLPDRAQSPGRYLAGSSHDFTAVFAR